jgi:hypothetical protein
VSSAIAIPEPVSGDPRLPPCIEIWNGPRQVSGALGVPQRWLNVLGRVWPPDGVTLSYQLNDGPPGRLSVGPNRRRLAHAGDFNVEIAHSELRPGANSIRITAEGAGGRTVEEVLVDHRPGTVWPLPYRVDWRTAPGISPAQIVDGRWQVGPAGLRPLEIGYDRAVALGDMSWRDVEVSLWFVIHALDETITGYPSFSPGFGVALRWQGHSDWSRPRAPRLWRALRRWWRNLPELGAAAEQPRRGWWPVGARGWYGMQPGLGYRLSIVGNADQVLAREARERRLAPGVPYRLTMRVRSGDPGPSTYGLKVWRADDPEPAHWDLRGRGAAGELATGSLLLVAHHADVSFAAVEVVAAADDPPDR